MKQQEISEEIQSLLTTVVQHFEKEDRAVRERQIRQWRKMKYLWSGFQRIWYSEVAHDWRVVDEFSYLNTPDQSYYDKQINIFRAYLESIIAALSTSIPSIKCYPDDANNPLDLSTAKAGDKIAELIYKHNDATLLWLHALFIFCTEGMIAAYSYPKSSEEYGTYQKTETEDVEEEQDVASCPICGNQVNKALDFQEENEFMPDSDDVQAHDLLLNKGQYLCPNCLAFVDPEFRKEKMIVTRVVGVSNEPKTRQCVEVYGGLYIKVPNYAIRQEDCPYLIFAREQHYSLVAGKYRYLNKKFSINTKLTPSPSGMYDPYERWGRLPPQYYSEYPINLVTIKDSWLRPCAFNILQDDSDIKKLKKLFPDGVKVTHVNQDFADAVPESLDDCWTLSRNPLSDYIHHDPLGSLLTSIQEITNDLISLVLQTIEHGIPQTFADPSVLNFEQYSQTEVTPGAIYPAKPLAGKAIGDSFYEVKTATLSGEVLPFTEKIQEAGQLVSGALPSLFGGAAPNSSKTASQYAMSRSQALQRLQTTWKMLTVWWKDIFGKVIPSYIKDVAEDERYVTRDDKGNFVNVFIRKSELQGKIGSVELEASEQLPITWAQKKDVIMQLLSAGNPMVMSAISTPENLPLIRDALGLNDLVLPGEDDREKQYEEIQQLLESQPLDPQTPSVDINPDLDNHQLESDICRSWLIGDAGRLAKIENPQGYQNVLLHMKRHVDIHQALTSMNQMTPPESMQNGPSGPPQNNGPQKPQPGAQNVPRIQSVQ